MILLGEYCLDGWVGSDLDGMFADGWLFLWSIIFLASVQQKLHLPSWRRQRLATPEKINIELRCQNFAASLKCIFDACHPDKRKNTEPYFEDLNVQLHLSCIKKAVMV